MVQQVSYLYLLNAFEVENINYKNIEEFELSCTTATG